MVGLNFSIETELLGFMIDKKYCKYSVSISLDNALRIWFSWYKSQANFLVDNKLVLHNFSITVELCNGEKHRKTTKKVTSMFLVVFQFREMNTEPYYYNAQKMSGD